MSVGNKFETVTEMLARERQKTSPWVDIPVEIMAVVVSYLDTGDIQTSRCVCRDWRRVVSYGVAEFSPRFPEKIQRATDVFPNIIKVSLGKCVPFNDDSMCTLLDIVNLQVLDMTGCEMITDASVKKLATLRRLTWLSLRNCIKITDEGVLALCGCPIRNMAYFTIHEWERKFESSSKRSSFASAPAPPLQFLDLSGCTLLTEISTKAIARNLKSLTELRLGGCNRVVSVSDDMLAPLQNCEKLHALDISGCVTVTHDGLHPLLIHLEQLKHLNLWNCLRLTSESLANLPATRKRLTELSLRGCHGITDVACAYISSLVHLARLDLRSCEKIQGHGLKQLKNLQYLKELNMKGCFGLIDSGVQGIGCLVHLEHLHLADCWQITDQGMIHLESLTNLITLDISRCRNIRNAEGNGISGIKHMTKLKTLCLRSCENLEGSHALSTLTGLQSLTYLDISGCLKLSHQSLESLVPLSNLVTLKCQHITTWSGPMALHPLGALSTIQHLNLSGCTNLVGTSFIHVRNMKQLKTIFLEGCTNVPLMDRCLVAISKLDSLEHISLQGSLNVTDEGIKHLGFSRSLRVLRLDDCDNIDGSGFSSWNTMNSLEIVSLQGCSSMNDDGIGQLVTKIPSLQELNIKQCRLLSDTSIKYITSSLGNLKKLYIQASLGITDTGVSLIAQHLTSLTHLSIQFCWKFGDESGVKLACMRNLKHLDLLYSWKITDVTLLALSTNPSIVDLNIFGCHRISDIGKSAVYSKLNIISR